MIHQQQNFAVKPAAQAVAFVLAVLGTVGVAPVHAQSAEAPAPQVQQEIVISASRIDRAGFTAPTPTTVVGAATLEQRATVNVGDLLNEIPAFRGTNSPSAGGIGNTGAALADLRGLTAQRTLVLLDRNRLPATNTPGTTVGGTTDMNIIPTALIRSVDVVTGGASAAYGSDAVAGVVNIVLNDKLEGIKGSVQWGRTTYGDAADSFVSLAGGTGFAGGKGHAIAGLEYNRNAGASVFNDRDWGKKGVASANFTSRPAGVPANIIAPYIDTLFATATTGGLILTAGPLQGTAFVQGANGATTTAQFSQGLYSNYTLTRAVFSDANVAANDAAGIVNRNYQQLRAGLERANFLSKVTYEINDKLSVFIEPLFSHVRTVNIGAQRRDGAGTGAGLPITRDNYYLQQALTPAQYALVPAAGISLGYLGNDIGPTVTNLTNNTSRILTGFKGEFGETWKWDVSYQNAQNNSDRNISNNTINANFRNAIDAVLVNGQVVCRSTAAQAAGCQPLNILGKTSGSAAAYAYAIGTANAHTVTRLKEITANLQGEPFEVWAGPVSVGFGLERRTESLMTTSDPISQAAGFAGGNTAALSAQQSVKEAYMETIVPLLKALPLVKTLDFNGAIRRTDYSSSGSVTTWKGGLTWEPTADFRLRTTRSRDIRAPNLVELYTPVAPTVPIPADPRPGVAPISNAAGVTTGGNPDLKPEIANTTTFGIVFQPTFIKRLNVSADYYRIDVKGAITTTTVQNVVNNCLPGGVYSGNAYCSLISFANNDVVNGQITRVQGTTANVATFKTHGIDMQLSYAQPLKELSAGMAGTLNVGVQGTRVFEYATSTDVSALFPQGINRAGQTGSGFGGPAGLPKWLWSTSLDYKLNRLSLNGQVRYIARSHQNNGFVGPDDSSYSPALVNSVNDNIVPSRTYVNVGGSYDFGQEGRREVYFTINNLFDRDPPLPANNNAYYDLLGRAFKVGMRFSFD